MASLGGGGWKAVQLAWFQRPTCGLPRGALSVAGLLLWQLASLGTRIPREPRGGCLAFSDTLGTHAVLLPHPSNVDFSSRWFRLKGREIRLSLLTGEWLGHVEELCVE